MKIRFYLILSLLIVWIGITAVPVSAHANLAQAHPPPNSAQATTPDEIRLWFTEPLEPRFSSIIVRDSSGAVVEIPPSSVDVDAPLQMALTLAPDDLSGGVYTVIWRALSAADGHTSEGSYAFTVGNSAALDGNVLPTNGILIDDSFPPEGVAGRWLQLLGAALLLGGTLFLAPQRAKPSHAKETRALMSLVTAGWIVFALANVALLIMQSRALDTDPVTLLLGTRYGTLWLIRIGILIGIALALLLLQGRTARTFSDIGGGALLATISLNSHAAATGNTLAIIADWMHLGAMAIWVGGLIAFLRLLWARRVSGDTVSTVTLVGTFSQIARLCVIALIVTGIYSALLHVGSIEALTTTTYGIALIVKMFLFLPVLALAAINLVLTARGLHRGDARWIGRLRGLVGAEIGLLLGVLVLSGVLTSANPAQAIVTARAEALIAAQAALAQPEPLFIMEVEGALMAHLEITPGIVGENTFAITLYDAAGEIIPDASRIRLRFENPDADTGRSELRPEWDGSAYIVRGANLSLPGDWELRMTVARPDEFDKIIDFEVPIAGVNEGAP